MNVLPWQSSRARVWWSIPLLTLVGAIWLGWMLDTTTSHPDLYTFPQALGTLAQLSISGLLSYWSGEDWVFVVAYPAVLGALWMLVLRPRTRRTARLVALWTLMLAPYWFVAWFALRGDWHDVLWITRAPIEFAHAILSRQDGEYYQEHGLFMGMLSIWWMVPLGLLVLSRSDRAKASCRACGYSTAGIRSNRCPECGAPYRSITRFL